MKPFRNPRFLSVLLIAILTVLACSLPGQGSTPTPPPPPTTVPSQPTPLPEPTSPPEPTAAPVATAPSGSGDGAPIEILMVNGFLDTFDSWNVVGLVRNNMDRTIDSVEIEIELFDAAGVSVFRDTTFADLFNLAPGEVAPFSFIVYEDLPEADNFIATIVGNSTTELERAFPEVTNTRMTIDDSGDIHLTGELVNTGDQPIIVNSLAGAVFDAGGQILTANSYSVAIRYLGPESSGPFRVTITGAETGFEALDSFTIYVDAEVDEAIDPFGLVISDAYNYVDAFDGLHLVGEVTNNGNQTLNVNLIAGIYDASGAVLDASDISLPIGALGPGEAQPYDFNFWGPLNYTEGLLSEADSYVIQVDAYWTWETDTVLLDLSTQNDANEFDTFGGEFTGQVVNDTGGPIDNVTIVIYVRDAATGQVTATGYDYVFDEIPDGGSADYLVFMDVPDDFDVDSAEYFIIVKGERP